MTRNEAIKKQEDLYPYGYSTSNVKLINQIYNDFEKEQLSNLAHLQMANEMIDKLKMELKQKNTNGTNEKQFDIFIAGYIGENMSAYDLAKKAFDYFGCNKWEAKDAIQKS